MKNIIYAICITIFIAGISFAQEKGKANGFSLKHTTRGNVTVKKGSRTGVINLRSEVAGCVYTTREMIKFAPPDCSAFGSKAEFKVVDAITKNGKYYLIIEAESPSGNTACNACGRCGADGATSLIWVKLDAKLKLEAKKSILYADCNTNTYPSENDNIDGDDYKFVKNELRIETKGRDYETDGKYRIILWKYSRNSPEKGFAIEKKTIVED